jgi:hypothetical protein
MSTATVMVASPKQPLCVKAFIMTQELLSRNTRPNFDDCYRQIKNSLLQEQEGEKGAHGN